LLGCAEILWRVDPAIRIGGSGGGGGGGDRYPTVANGATVLQDAVAAVAEKAAVPRAVVRAVEIFGLPPAGEHIHTRKNSTAGKQKKGKKIKRKWRARRKYMEGKRRNRRKGDKGEKEGKEG
jgi:hypothetical protein